MAKDKLDRKQPFGEITGDSQGRRYEQNGQFFGPEGDAWTDPNAPMKPQTKAEIAAAEKAAKAEAERLELEAAELAKKGVDPIDDQLGKQ